MIDCHLPPCLLEINRRFNEVKMNQYLIPMGTRYFHDLHSTANFPQFQRVIRTGPFQPQSWDTCNFSLRDLLHPCYVSGIMSEYIFHHIHTITPTSAILLSIKYVAYKVLNTFNILSNFSLTTTLWDTCYYLILQMRTLELREVKKLALLEYCKPRIWTQVWLIPHLGCLPTGFYYLPFHRWRN